MHINKNFIARHEEHTGIPAVGTLRQEDHKFEDMLDVYIINPLSLSEGHLDCVPL